MDGSIDKFGMIDLLDKSFILSSTIGILPEFWNTFVRLATTLRLPSPKALYDVAAKYMDQYTQSGKTLDEADDSAPTTFTAKIVALEHKGKMNSWDALSVCVNNVIAGSDTTAITLNAALYHIYTIPGVLMRLRDEIDNAAERGEISDPITFAEAQKLPFLQAVISEALRVHPAVGVSLVREVPAGGAQIDGYFFPQSVSEEPKLPLYKMTSALTTKKTQVGVNAWGLNYNENIYGPDAHQFRPERWFENSIGTTTSAISQFAVCFPTYYATR